MRDLLQVCDLGVDVPYEAAGRLQESCHAARIGATLPDLLLLLEHVPVYTMGRSAAPENLRWDPTALQRAGIALHETRRGGDVTYHGPGQLVGYPIVHLSRRGMRVIEYVTALEEVLIRGLAQCGLNGAGRDSRNRGVWIGNNKIAAIGIRVSRQVTQHGFALNINTRLEDYGGIVPCGLQDAGVTSLARELGRPVPMHAVKDAIVEAFKSVFGYARTQAIPPSALPATSR